MRQRTVFIEKLVIGKKVKRVRGSSGEAITPPKKLIKTITTDNGTEFSEHKYIAKMLHTTVYFADPYASWQKGAIENTNKLIRQYIPKDMDFKHLDNQQVKQFQYKLNKRPREKIDFNSPLLEFAKHLK